MILGCVLGPAIVLTLAVLITTSDELLESFDPHHPATLLPIVLDRVHDVFAAASELLRNLLDRLIDPYRQHIQRTIPTEPLPQ